MCILITAETKVKYLLGGANGPALFEREQLSGVD